MLSDEYIERLYSHNNDKGTNKSLNLPIIPSKDVMKALRYEFEYNHRSIVCFLNQLKMALAHHFVRQGKSCVCVCVRVPISTFFT